VKNNKKSEATAGTCWSTQKVWNRTERVAPFKETRNARFTRALLSVRTLWACFYYMDILSV